MSVTQTRADAATTAPGRTSAKVAAGFAALLGIALFMTVASVDVPHDASDSEFLAWWQDKANRTSGLMSAISAFGVAVTIPVVINHIRSLGKAAAAPQWLGYARSMAAAVTAVWLVTGAARGVMSHLVDLMDEPLPNVDVLRTMTGFNYMLLGFSGMGVLGLCILAVSVVVLRTGALARWVGYVGAVCSVIMLAAVAAQFGAFTTPLGILWAFCIAVAIWRQPAQD